MDVWLGFPHLLWGCFLVIFKLVMCRSPKIPFTKHHLHSGYVKIAIEHGHRNSEFSHLTMVIFHSYVSLPEGISYISIGNPCTLWHRWHR